MYSPYELNSQNLPRFSGIIGKIRDVPSNNLFQFSDEWTQFSLARFQNSLKKIHSAWWDIFFYEINCFLEFSKNNGKSGKDYI